ncbi:MAG TPA: DUF4914 family protein [Firmicutes bacterium]|jgi:hypothetical protein|nr:DUF4914 family protein [Bacillota bacterium]
MNNYLERMNLGGDLKEILGNHPRVTVPKSREHILDLAMGGKGRDLFEISYNIAGYGKIVEATVARCKNGIVANYVDDYMRRRDPDSMIIADDKATDKPRYRDVYKKDFGPLRQLSFDWLKKESLIVMPFPAGGEGENLSYPALLIGPENAGFFAGGLADLQGFIPAGEIPEGFTPRAVIYLVPPFRQTHFDGKQIVVHNRQDHLHEIFSYNLYPGPSAKKGVYSVLLDFGEQEGWLTAHASTVKVITPYDNTLVLMHEGASGGGKSEMIGPLHREDNGRLLLARGIDTGEQIYLDLKETSELCPITDDMALCHSSFQQAGKKLVVKDAENGWFLRINHITSYGTDPFYEKLSIHPGEPLFFFNLQGTPGSTCLIWEHTLDSTGEPCPNPRVIMPRKFVPDTVDEPIEVDVRSFGVRTPPCTREKPTYGIIGMLHILPPALAWLWRLVSPRGYDNPSIISGEGLSGEGVGSYWPFATGKMVDQANLLLEQMINTPETKYSLIPNQYIGAYKVGFMPQWIIREYLARRGTVHFKPEQKVPARCPLLGEALNTLKVDGTYITRRLLQVDRQHEVGEEGYDAGARILTDFFKEEIKQFLTPDLSGLGKKIIECCLNDGAQADYENIWVAN